MTKLFGQSRCWDRRLTELVRAYRNSLTNPFSFLLSVYEITRKGNFCSHVSSVYQQPRSLLQLRAWWGAKSGYRDVLVIAGPLVLSTGSTTIQQFIDRMFLSWYSPASLAASLPAGIFSFAVLCLFIGTASYATTFVAQYTGAGQPQRAAASVWQAIYFSAGAGLLILPIVPCSERIFALAGHAPAIRRLEAQYFEIIIAGGGFAILSTAISSFFTGLGMTRIVMWANIGATAVNIVLDYGLIFGNLGMPEMGIRGAAIATVASSMVSAAVLFWRFLIKENREIYFTLRSWKPDAEIFRRLMRFGIPSGIQFMLDLFAFTLFILLVGRLGELELAATTLAFQLNTLAFLPMIGFSIATSTLVGQRLGENKPYLATRSVWAAFHLTCVYMFSMAFLYVVMPGVLLTPFGARSNPVEFAQIHSMAVIILRFVAVYCLFDAMNLIFASALKGAGDTLFVMALSTTLGIILLVIPAWIVCRPGGAGIYAAWTWLTIFVIVLGFSFLFRFLRGKWQHLRVIDTKSDESTIPDAI